MAMRRIRIAPEVSDRHTRQTAAALEYKPDRDRAPRVVASGRGKKADKILEVARQHNIPVFEDPILAAALAMVDLGQEIPPELYRVVAEVLVYISRVAGRVNRGR